MGILEDAKRLADSCITQEGTAWCHFCRGMIEEPGSYDPPLPYSEQHDSDCPWLAMPRIVAVLEAARRVAQAYESETVEQWGGGGGFFLSSPLLNAVNALSETLDEQAP